MIGFLLEIVLNVFLFTRKKARPVPVIIFCALALVMLVISLVKGTSV